jgi:hypothetical protein
MGIEAADFFSDYEAFYQVAIFFVSIKIGIHMEFL